MALFEVQGPDGKTYEVEAPSIEAAAAAIGSVVSPNVGGSRANKPAVDDLKNRLTVASANAANAMTFGLGDEASGAIAGIKGVVGGEGYLPAYREERDAVRNMMGTVNEAYPGSALAGKIAGGVVPALASAPLAQGNTMLQTMLRGGGVGALEGVAHGAGNADGGDMASEALRGALIGGGVGLAAPVVVGAIGAAKNAIKDPVTGAFGIASKSKANRAIADLIGKSNTTPEALEELVRGARLAGQPEFRMVDALGLPGQRAANGLTRAGGAPGNEVAEFLATRQAGQGDRVGAFVEDAFGVGGTTAAKTKDALTAARRVEDTANYGAAAASAKPVDVRDAVTKLDETISQMSGSGLVPTRVVDEFTKLRAKLAGAAPDGSPTTLSDYKSVLALWREVRDDVDKAYRGGDGALGEALKPIKDSLKASLADSSDEFLTANKASAASKANINAVDEGAMMATRGRAADNIPKFGALAAPGQGAMRVGYGDRLLGALEDVKAPTANRAKALMSQKRVTEADAMALDPRLYADRLARENTMWETMNRALGGSRTADNLQDMGAMEGLAGGAFDATRSAASGNFGNAVSKIAGMIAPLARGQNEATRNLIAKALLSSNPTQVLAPVIAQSNNSAAVRRIVEAIIRQPMREGGEASIQ